MRLPKVIFSILHIVTLSAALAFPADWQALNASVEGRLFQGTPYSRPCFSSARRTGGVFDSEECTLIQNNYTTRDLRIQEFGAYMNTEWETCQLSPQECLLDSSQPGNTLAFDNRTCEQGSVPSAYIDALNANDIIAAFNFSRDTGVPLVIKNTGHDYKGRSSGPGTLAIWTHNFQNLSYDPSFVPEGCPSSSAKPGVTLGAGVRHAELYAFADANKITVLGGTDPTVGAAGGYFQGGGHSALSNMFGLAVDRALQIEVVVPTGQILVANECQNADLFFALRGGGGGTFGVVLSLTELALPQLSFPVIQVQYVNNTENEQLFMSYIIDNMNSLSQQGWGGFIVPSNGLIFANPKMSKAEADASVQGLQSLVVDKLNGTFLSVLMPSWLDFFTTFLIPTDVPVGLPFAVSSRIIPKANFETAESRAELLDALLPAANNVPASIIFSVAPSFFAENGGNTSATSINPIWYKSLWHVTASGFWNFNTTFVERLEIYSLLTKAMDPLRRITPGSGAYQNEADVYEPNHTESYWGPNYARLLAIKEKYDPDHLLDCWHCVGSNGGRDPRFQCYIPESFVRL
ncbi:hypothetical protein M0805_009400 [Coniferiporia weirii]|nr:hypothetical protein M0805_009400 [Coniferiporia weirii]